MAVRLFHPLKFNGELIAVRVLRYAQHPRMGHELQVDVATRQAAHRGLTVRHGSLVDQWIPWLNRPTLTVGWFGQSGSGFTGAWRLDPVPEVDRHDVEQLLALGHVQQLLSTAPQQPVLSEQRDFLGALQPLGGFRL